MLPTEGKAIVWVGGLTPDEKPNQRSLSRLALQLAVSYEIKRTEGAAVAEWSMYKPGWWDLAIAVYTQAASDLAIILGGLLVQPADLQVGCANKEDQMVMVKAGFTSVSLT